MAKVLVVTSGKGGVGKTTSTAAIGAALAQAGQKVAVVDFDVGLRNLDLVMGAERRVVFDLINVVHGVAKLPQALIRDKRVSAVSSAATIRSRQSQSSFVSAGSRSSSPGSRRRSRSNSRSLWMRCAGLSVTYSRSIAQL